LNERSFLKSLIVHIRNLQLTGSPARAILIAGCVLSVFLCLLTVKWSFGYVNAVQAEEPEVAEFGMQLAGRDPYAHFKLASLLEKTLLAGDQVKALHHFEAAAAFSPDHYGYWLALGRAREQAGDSEGAERALRRAADLAPFYSRVRWALGNLLLRQGRSPEAFANIGMAVAADPALAAPAAATAFRIFGGDIQKISEAIGDEPLIRIAVVVQLVNAKRLAEARAIWRRITAEDKRAVQPDIAKALYAKLIEGGKYASAIEVAAETGLFTDADAAIGTISNGEFESALAAENAHTFTWSIADGTQPRIGLNESQKHGGNYSLLISYGPRGNGSRPIIQKVGVEGGTAYVLRFFYRSELNNTGAFRCDILPAGGGEPITGVVLPPAAEWTEMQLDLVVPADSEGIEIKLFNACPPANCSVSGSIWLDDFTLSKR